VNKPHRTDYRYFDIVMAAWVIVLCVSSTAGGPKVTHVFGLTVGAGIFFYPFIYIFNDIMTEVYGYAHSRRAVWMGFAGLLFASVMTLVITWLPPAPDWKDQAAYVTVFGQTPRIVFASLVAFACGEFVNSFILAKLKIVQDGHQLWLRMVGSTALGVAVDSLIFYPGAFYGTWPNGLLLTVMGTEYLLKVGGEFVFTPITYQVVNFLKRAEHEDYYDLDTDFNPFTIQV
jgi:hypothetical protein